MLNNTLIFLEKVVKKLHSNLYEKKKKIVLITTGQPSGNPRIVKEADAFLYAGYDVTLLYCYFIEWGQEKDKQLLSNVKWKYKLVGGCPRIKNLQYNFTRVRFKIAKILNKYLGNTFNIAERAQARAYDELLSEAKKVKADWYIGHNLGTLAVAVKAATFNKGKAGFDFEDYHREESECIEQYIINRTIFLENKYVLSLSYYSTASDLITEITKLNHYYFKGKVITLLNCFPLSQQPSLKQKVTADNTLQLFWFSQTIGKNRGLEVLLEALRRMKNANIHLTLAGRCDDDMFGFINTYAGNLISCIHFAGIIQPEDLPKFASQFHVGLALETSFCKNNDIALSNKFFTYLLAGNAIISSETTMQLIFNTKYKVGESFNTNDVEELIGKINYYFDNNLLNKQKLYNYRLAADLLNWQNESKKLLAVLH